MLLQAAVISEQDLTILGDDPEVHLEHPIYHYLLWISYIYPLCKTYIREKVVDEFFFLYD